MNYQVPFTMDEKGFVHWNGFKLPIKYCPEKEQLEFALKDPTAIQRNGGKFVRVDIVELQVLSLMYPAGYDYTVNAVCPDCGKRGSSNFVGIMEHDGLPKIKLKCLHCNFSWSLDRV